MGGIGLSAPLEVCQHRWRTRAGPACTTDWPNGLTLGKDRETALDEGRGSGAWLGVDGSGGHRWAGAEDAEGENAVERGSSSPPQRDRWGLWRAKAAEQYRL